MSPTAVLPTAEHGCEAQRLREYNYQGSYDDSYKRRTDDAIPPAKRRCSESTIPISELGRSLPGEIHRESFSQDDDVVPDDVTLTKMRLDAALSSPTAKTDCLETRAEIEQSQERTESATLPCPEEFQSFTTSQDLPTQPDSPKNELDRAISGSLTNMGNTCYLNAGVQALRSLTEFITCLEENPPSTFVRIYDETIRTMRQLNSSDSLDPIEPKELRDAVAAEKTHLEHFLGYEQQDAHEFFNELVDRLHDDIETHSEVCAVAEHFTYEMDSKLNCTSCHYDRTKKEKLRNLPLSLSSTTSESESSSSRTREDYDAWPRVTSLDELWSRFFMPELLEYNCEKCKGNESRVERSITRYPKVLSLQLKRFEMQYIASANDFSYIKIADPIDIPDSLLLEDNYYELRSVVCHEGSRPDCGHYTCWVRHRDGDFWTLYNDSFIETRNEFPEDIREKAYLVFYAQQRTPSTESP